MFYVRFLKPMPGCRSEIFVFHTEAEAQEFESSVYARWMDAETESGTVGEASEVFPGWSF